MWTTYKKGKFVFLPFVSQLFFSEWINAYIKILLKKDEIIKMVIFNII